MAKYKFPGVYIEEQRILPRSIKGVPTSIPVFIGYTENATSRDTSILVKTLLEFEQIFGGIDSNGRYLLYPSLKLFYENGGEDCYIISVGDYSNPVQLSDFENGLRILSRNTIPTLLVIPEAVHLNANDCYDLQNQMLNHCGRRKYRMTILDIFEGFKKTTTAFNPVEQFRNNITVANSYRSYGAAYHPWLKSKDGFLPPSGAIAGIYVSTDKTRGVWKAPANVKINGITSLTVKISHTEQGTLNVHTSGLSINVLRYFTGKGNLVWGSRTLLGNDSEWRYVPVRRFSMFLQQSIKIGLKNYLFEPNDTSTWDSIKKLITNFLMKYWRSGALQGAKPKHAFFVLCGLNETMTAVDLSNNYLRVEIGFAAIRPAEFIILKFNQKQIVS